MLKNNLHIGFHGLVLVVVGTLMFSLISCGGGVPRKYIQPSTMEDILYDYHMLQSVQRVLSIDSAMSKEYLQTIYDKYDITQADFDSSMVYYLRHADMLQDMYKHLSERIEKEAIAQGVEGGFVDFSSGDTANVWRLERARVFNTHAPYNVMQFNIPVDTAFKAGDKMILTFKSDFLFETGSRSGLAVMSVTLKNDSVITRSLTLSGQSRQQLEISDANRVGIKAVQGFFLQKESSMPADRTSASVRMMIISDIKLIRMHTQEVKKTKEPKEELPEGAVRPDSVNPQPGVAPPPTNADPSMKSDPYIPPAHGNGAPPPPPTTGVAKPLKPATPANNGNRPMRGTGTNVPKPARTAVTAE